MATASVRWFVRWREIRDRRHLVGLTNVNGLSIVVVEGVDAPLGVADLLAVWSGLFKKRSDLLSDCGYVFWNALRLCFLFGIKPLS